MHARGRPDQGVAVDLRPDCARCFALCCVAPSFTASTEFGHTKPAGCPCTNLRDDGRCGIHRNLRANGYSGCTVYDCFGAGQQVARVTFGGQDWRAAPHLATRMFATLPIMRQLHESLWYLLRALELPATRPLHAELRQEIERTATLTRASADELARLDTGGHWREITDLLARASELARAPFGGHAIDHHGADLIEADLAGADLRGANLRGACMVGARLQGADLDCADVSGADLRGAQLAGADLAGTLFLHQHQLQAANGDEHTRLPGGLDRPAHW